MRNLRGRCSLSRQEKYLNCERGEGRAAATACFSVHSSFLGNIRLNEPEKRAGDINALLGSVSLIRVPETTGAAEDRCLLGSAATGKKIRARSDEIIRGRDASRCVRAFDAIKREHRRGKLTVPVD